MSTVERKIAATPTDNKGTILPAVEFEPATDYLAFNEGRVRLLLQATGEDALVVEALIPMQVAEGIEMPPRRITAPPGFAVVAGPFPTHVFNEPSGDNKDCIRFRAAAASGPGTFALFV